MSKTPIQQTIPGMINGQKVAWHTDNPPAEVCNQPMYLMTICGVVIWGHWSGKVGQYFTMWAEEIYV